VAERGDEQVERSLRFRLGRLDEERAMDDQRKIHGHRMEPLVNHRLGEIEGGEAGALEKMIVEQHFVHAAAVAERLRHEVGKAGADVVGRSEEHTSELQSRQYLVCRLLLE